MAHGEAPQRSSTIARALGVLRHRPYLIFWIGAFISNTGNWTENAGQSWAVTTQTAGSPHQGLMVEILQFADFCPVLLLALLAGVISDRVNRRIWLIILQSAACVLGASLAVAAYLKVATPWVVIAFTFFEGIVWAFNAPVYMAIVPSLVPRAELDRAIALNSVQFNLARLCGPMIAAGLIGVIGVAGAFTFNACTFIPLLIALWLAIPQLDKPAQTSTTSISHDVREGLKFVWTNRGTRRLTIMSLVFMFLSAPLQGLLPVFAQSVLGGGGRPCLDSCYRRSGLDRLSERSLWHPFRPTIRGIISFRWQCAFLRRWVCCSASPGCHCSVSEFSWCAEHSGC